MQKLTDIVKINPERTDTPEAGELLRRAGEVILSGGLVAFPTETVYGLGGNAFDPEASAKIYEAKGRPSDNPLIVHIAGIGDLDRLTPQVPREAIMLADRFWPGPLTMILKKRPEVPRATTGGLDTVAVRFPSHPVARALIREGGGFIAAPSANRSGRPSPTTAAHCIEDLTGRVNMIIDGGEVGIGVESSIVDLTEEVPMLLRPGYVTAEELSEVLGQVVEDPGAAGPHPKAPGMKYRHYAPKAQMTMVIGEPQAVCAYINEQAALYAAEHWRVGVLASAETAASYTGDLKVYVLGHRTDAEEIAGNLFGLLRQCDAEGTEILFSEAFYGDGLFRAVMNRMEKACGHRIVRL